MDNTKNTQEFKNLDDKLLFVIDEYLKDYSEGKNVIAIAFNLCNFYVGQKTHPVSKSNGKVNVPIPEEFLHWNLNTCKNYLRPFLLEITSDLFFDIRNSKK